MLELVVPKKDEVIKVAKWRNEVPYALRTPFFLTEEMQSKFYEDVICNRNAKARYWSIVEKKPHQAFSSTFIGLAGLENIEWENGLAEISLILDPAAQGKGLGKQALFKLLEKGFDEMRLENIYGECYDCNPSVRFWSHMVDVLGAYHTVLLGRKYWKGTLYNALWFNISRSNFRG